MRMLCKPCQLFSYDSNEGMKAFCIIEMFLALFHLTVAISRVPVVERLNDGWYDSVGEDYDYLAERFWAGFTALFITALIIQSILAFFLYFLGWKKKNWIVCIVWASFAGLNFLLQWILFIFYMCDSEGTGLGWDYYLLYLLYPAYGIWIVVDFIFSEIGRPRGRFFHPTSSPSSAKPDSSKKPDTQA